jgi:hypothetical protein
MCFAFGHKFQMSPSLNNVLDELNRVVDKQRRPTNEEGKQQENPFISFTIELTRLLDSLEGKTHL